MGRRPVKALNNPYCQARLRAAEYNEHLASRQTAAPELNVSVESLTDYELGRCKQIPLDIVLTMADLYSAPELLNHYCSLECPIGRQRVPYLDANKPIERACIQISVAARDMDKTLAAIEDIVADGVVTPNEMPELERVIAKLQVLRDSIDGSLIVFEKAKLNNRL